VNPENAATAPALPPAALDARGWLKSAARHLKEASTAVNTAYEQTDPDSEEEKQASDAREALGDRPTASLKIGDAQP